MGGAIWVARLDAIYLKRHGGKGHTLPRPPSPKPHEGEWTGEQIADMLFASIFRPTPLLFRYRLAKRLLNAYPPSEKDLAEFWAAHP
jgi:hypothetical protein